MSYRGLVTESHNRHLTGDEIEHNIGSLPVTDNRIQELFETLDEDQSGTLPVQKVKTFYMNMEHYGLDPTDVEAEKKIRKYANTFPDALTYDEFACFVLSIAQW
ncbi:hypothetical protein STCU_00591 [Strigomonas culicis]|uniref:EF-hand domain-containing protein n=1 Tax=Strigomonas culicis TaxID=28005 RepID=S9UZY8_9TRYP|nr:hypothetical protein STCU_07388 [Strigomonas culicis]EPY36427.1 hypothetical protein STCU_00591 [Strigomonas culicis]|eukprot:EPY23937.1 hypothetical protein STCU_07388 [Strigomonas culicis]